MGSPCRQDYDHHRVAMMMSFMSASIAGAGIRRLGFRAARAR
jgi:hypothetical protein